MGALAAKRAFLKVMSVVGARESLASSWLILASKLGGFSRREEISHGAWGRRVRFPRVRGGHAARRSACWSAGLPVPVAGGNGLGRSEPQMGELQKSSVVRFCSVACSSTQSTAARTPAASDNLVKTARHARFTHISNARHESSLDTSAKLPPTLGPFRTRSNPTLVQP